MVRVYANENMDNRVVQALRDAGHDVLTTRDTGRDNQGVPDSEVLALANGDNRVVVTFNRKDYVMLHRSGIAHAGIIVCTEDPDYLALADRLDLLLRQHDGAWAGRLGKVVRPG